MARRTALALVAIAALSLTLPATAPAAKAKKYKFGARTLKLGTKGKDVRFLQRSLTTLGHTTRVSGVFTRPTRKSVKGLEKRQRWAINGIVTRKDAKKIRRLLAGRQNDVYFLYQGSYPAVTVRGQAAGRARVDVIDVATGLPVTQIPVSFDAAGDRHVSWNTLISSGGYAPDSTYLFQLGDAGATGATVVGGQVNPFLLRAYAFPVPGSHSFGGAGSRFGAPRGDHTHQGQDVAAACGTPLYAAQGGVVQVKAYQAGGAGYYLVVHGAPTGTDTVYMHMREPSPLLAGQAVYTNQLIGYVGNTGSSSGCHLHFEHWTYPGWYEGGAPYDPLPELTYWDTYS